MKYSILFFICTLCTVKLTADTCVFPGELNFTTQAQINAFLTSNPTCTEIDGDVFINGADITNLNGLTNIIAVYGSFQVVNCPMLTGLAALSDLDSVGGTFRLSGLPLTSLNGLQNLRHVRGCAIDLNHTLTNLTGLSGLVTITNTFRVWQNNNLLTLNGLNSLIEVGNLDIHANATLINVNGLANLDTAYLEYGFIYDNAQLSFCGAAAFCAFLSGPSDDVEFEDNASGCNSNTEVLNSCDGCPGGDVDINSQADLQHFLINYPTCMMIDGNVSIYGGDINDLSALSNIVSIGGHLDIVSCPMLTDLDGLQSLESVGSFFRISSIPLQDVDELTGLTSVGGLSIDLNTQLLNLDGLSSLTTVTNTLHIWQNAVLNNLSGLSNLTTANIVEIDQNATLASLNGLQNIAAAEVEFLTIRWCPNLSLCAIESVCTFLYLKEDDASIHDNASGCDSNEEVLSICLDNCIALFDTDGDGYCDNVDNCPTVSNPMQTDDDNDGEGNRCDCDDDIKADNEEGVDCGGPLCVPCGPPNAVCGVMTVYVNPAMPDRNGPGTQDIWNIAASALDAGSTSFSLTPEMQVKRYLSNLTFDWTTDGSCVDIISNGGALSNMDKGTIYRDCYPATTADFNKNKLYKLFIEDEFGSDECSGTVKVIASGGGGYHTPVIHLALPKDDLISVNRTHSVVESGTEFVSVPHQFMVMPNPGADVLQVSWVSHSEEQVGIHVTELSGRKIIGRLFDALVGDNVVVFDMSDATAGVYIVTIKTNDTLISEKWVKSF